MLADLWRRGILPILPRFLFATILCIFLIWLICSIRKPGVGYWRWVTAEIFRSSAKRRCWWCRRKFYHHSSDQHYCSKKCEREAAEESRQVMRHNNRCKKHPFQRVTYRNECMDCMVKRWSTEHRIPKHRKCFCLLHVHGFKWFPTLRNSEQQWGGDKIAMDSHLQMKGYRWLVYIKLYLDKNGIARPLVVGKSGSLSVNSRGTDLSFSTVESDGPARRFLKQGKLKWCTEWILVKRCKNELKAYELEAKIARKYDLYGS